MSDGHCHGPRNFDGFSLCIPVANDEQAERQFAALREGGKRSPCR